MEFNSQYEFEASPAAVFDALTSAATVAGCLPGCDALKPLGDDRYEAAMADWLAPA